MSDGRVVTITGTDTGVGKTVVTAALACAARAVGPVAVYKPVQTGARDGDSDIAEVVRLASPDTAMVGSEQPEPLAPVAAARRAGRELPPLTQHLEEIRRLQESHVVVLVEGAGGVLVHLTEQGDSLADLARASGASTVIVARAGLGTLNHSALTAEALTSRRCPIAGLVVGSWPAEPDLATRCNVDDLPTFTGLPVLGRLPEGASGLPPEEFRRLAPGWVRTAGWLT